MAERRRIGHALYVTASGTFQTWYRTEDDRQVWESFSTIEAAITRRDSERAKRSTYTRSFGRTRVGKLAKLLAPPPPTKQQEIEQLLNTEPPDPDIPVYRIVH